MEEHEYVRFFVVRVSYGCLEPIHPGALPFYEDAEKLVREFSGVKLAIIDEATWNAYEAFNADGVCECGTERTLVFDAKGTYWECPECHEG